MGQITNKFQFIQFIFTAQEHKFDFIIAVKNGKLHNQSFDKGEGNIAPTQYAADKILHKGVHHRNVFQVDPRFRKRVHFLQ